jgi:hypothetical protein
VRQCLEEQEQKYPDDEKICPYCGAQAKYVRRQEGMTMMLQGRVYFRRNYYSCLDGRVFQISGIDCSVAKVVQTIVALCSS